MNDLSFKELKKELLKTGMKFSVQRLAGILRKKSVIRTRWKIYEPDNNHFYKYVEARAGLLPAGKCLNRIAIRSEKFIDGERIESFGSVDYDTFKEWFVEIVKIYLEDKDRLEWL